MAKVGRPLKEIDWKIFDELCEIHCTKEEISHIFDCSLDTIEKRLNEEKGMNFTAYHKKKSSKGKASLRRRLYKIADSDHKQAVTALIWLSKNYLGMKDKIEVENEGIEPFIIETSVGEITLGIRQKETKKNDE